MNLLNANTHQPTATYAEKMFSAGFLQLISHPTRLAHCNNYSSATLIDHLWSNEEKNQFTSGILTLPISDHFATFALLGLKKEKAKPQIKKIRVFNEEKMERFFNALSNYSYEDVLESQNAQTSYNIFHHHFFNLYDSFFPLQEKKINKNFCKIEPWFTKGLLKSRQTKLALGKMCLYSPEENRQDDLLIYKTYKNL